MDQSDWVNVAHCAWLRTQDRMVPVRQGAWGALPQELIALALGESLSYATAEAMARRAKWATAA